MQRHLRYHKPSNPRELLIVELDALISIRGDSLSRVLPRLHMAAGRQPQPRIPVIHEKNVVPIHNRKV